MPASSSNDVQKSAAVKKKKKATTIVNNKKNPKKKEKIPIPVKCKHLSSFLNSPLTFSIYIVHEKDKDAVMSSNVLKSYGGNVTNGDGVDHYANSSDEDYSDDEEEGEESYKPGGYHPVNIGDKFNNNRYTVIEKLGWGHFSTVWMCYDKKKSTPEDPVFVAIKVQKSASHYREAALDEVELLSCINEAATTSAVISEGLYVHNHYIVRLVDHFDHIGPNGKHVCMVFEMLGENLLKIIKKYEYRGIPIPIVKNFARQICLGLDYLHRHCQIIHTDLKPENILVAISPRPSDMERVMNLVGDGNKAKKTKKKTGDTHELQEAMDKLSMEETKLTSEQKKKLKKKQKKKKQEQKKKEAKKRGHRSANGKSSRNRESRTQNEEGNIDDKDQVHLEMMLMERESAPKDGAAVPHPTISISHAAAPSSSSAPIEKSKISSKVAEEGKDSVDLKSDEENPDFGITAETYDRCRLLRPSAVSHINFDSSLDFFDHKSHLKANKHPHGTSDEHHTHHSSTTLPQQVRIIPKETYLPPPGPFLASIPMVRPFHFFPLLLSDKIIFTLRLQH